MFSPTFFSISNILNANSWTLFGISFIFLIFDYWTTSLAYAILNHPFNYILIIFFVLKVSSIFCWNVVICFLIIKIYFFFNSIDLNYFLGGFIQRRCRYLEISCRVQRSQYTTQIPLLKLVKIQLIKNLTYQKM